MNGIRSVIHKITRPRLASSHHRTDLHNLLDEASSRQIIVVSGPPGTGKTNLVSSYIESRNLPNIWYLIDRDDDNPETLFYCMGVALRAENPRKIIAMPYFTPKSSPGISVFAKLYFQEFYKYLEVPFLIVLDNYQELAEDAALHEAIQYMRTELPKGGRIVIITTKKFPPTFAQLRASNMVAIIEQDDLRLTQSEAKPVALMHKQSPSSNEEAVPIGERVSS